MDYDGLSIAADKALADLLRADLRGHRRDVRMAFDRARRSVLAARDLVDRRAAASLFDANALDSAPSDNRQESLL